MIKQFFRYCTDSDYRFIINANRGFYESMPDREYLERMFKAKMGYDLDLEHPLTFNEKLQWLKLYDRKPVYTTMVDKYEAKKYVSDIIGEKYIVPTLGIWEHFDEIDFDALPSKFVMKCTHDSGGLVICRDKSNLDITSAKQKITSSQKYNYYYKYREWPYKNVKPRIIIESYLEEQKGSNNNENGLLNDYKLQCFDGRFDNIFVAEGRFSKRGVRFHYFDKGWNYLPYSPYIDVDIRDLGKLKPRCLDEMIEISEKLSKGLPQLRVDLYEVNGRVYFGELTFYSQSGFDTDITADADKIMGDHLVLPCNNG